MPESPNPQAHAAPRSRPIREAEDEPPSEAASEPGDQARFDRTIEPPLKFYFPVILATAACVMDGSAVAELVGSAGSLPVSTRKRTAGKDLASSLASERQDTSATALHLPTKD